MFRDTFDGDAHWIVGDQVNFVVAREIFDPTLCVDTPAIGDEADFHKRLSQIIDNFDELLED